MDDGAEKVDDQEKSKSDSATGSQDTSNDSHVKGCKPALQSAATNHSVTKKPEAVVRVRKCDQKSSASVRSKSRSKSPRVDKIANKDETNKPKDGKTKTKSPAKQPAKRKSDSTDDKKEESAPKTKQPKKIIKVALGKKLSKISGKKYGDEGILKPKRKYIRKNKIGSSNNPVEESEQSTLLPQQGVKNLDGANVVENGDVTNAETKPLPVKARKKPGPKKGSKRTPKADGVVMSKSKQANKCSASSSKADIIQAIDAEADSDTVDYSASLAADTHGLSDIPPGPQAVPDVPQTSSSSKVIKIDDIEITELSDLNSSREESSEESEVKKRAEHSNAPVPTFINMDDCEQPDKTFLCSYPNCKYHGKNRVGMRKHLSHHHIYLCAHCDFHCNANNDLDTHMVANHPQRWGRKKCKKCQRYIRGDIFDSHEVICDGTTLFTCELCDKVFKYESKLHDHEKKFHAHIKCEQCDFVAENKLNLNQHIRSAHPKPKKPRIRKSQKSDAPSSTSSGPNETISAPQLATEKLTDNGVDEDLRKVIVKPAASPVGTVLISPLDDSPEKVISSQAVSTIDTTVSDCDLDSITSIPIPIIKQDSIHIVSDSSGQVTLSIPDSSVPDSLGANFLMSPDSTTPMLYPPNKAPETQTCDVDGCGRVLKTYRLLVNHKKTVHNILPSQLTYPCDHPDCNYVFKKKGQLKKHQVVHTGKGFCC